MKRFAPDMNDEELDDLFREAARQHARQPLREGDAKRKALLWGRLRRRLDAPKASGRRLLLVILLTGAGIAGFLLYRMAGDRQARQATNEQTTASVIQLNRGNKSATPAASDPPGAAARTPDMDKIGIAPQKAKRTDPPPYVSASLGNPAKSRPSRWEMPHTRKSNINLDPEQGHSRPLPSAFPGKRLQSLSFISTRKSVVVPARLASGDLHAQLPMQESTEDTPGANPPAGQYRDHKKRDKEQPAPPHRHWRLGLTLGSDWHSVAAKKWHAGVNGGLMLTYRINGKWAAGTGILVDKMIYQARPNDYHPSNNDWQNYDVQYINGNCLAVEVPLNAEYTLWRQAGHRIFVRGGLSSFWMHSEAYTYHYKTASNDWGQWNKKIEDKNYPVFSVINISPGYESRWKNLSLDIAPYIKIPLHGMGYGKVKLYGAGIRFSLGYELK